MISVYVYHMYINISILCTLFVIISKKLSCSSSDICFDTQIPMKTNEIISSEINK